EERDGARVVGVDNGLRPGGRHDLHEAVGDGRQGCVPRDGLEAAFPLGSHPTQWPGQAGLGGTPLAVISHRAPGRQPATADRMVGVATDVGDRAVALDYSDPAGVKTVPWTGGENDFLAVWHRLSLPSWPNACLHAAPGVA